MGQCLSRQRRGSRSASDDEIAVEIPELSVGSLARQHKPGSPHKPRTSSPQTRDALLRALRQLQPPEEADAGHCTLRSRHLAPLPEARSSHEAPSESGDANCDSQQHAHAHSPQLDSPPQRS